MRPWTITATAVKVQHKVQDVLLPSIEISACFKSGYFISQISKNFVKSYSCRYFRSTCECSGHIAKQFWLVLTEFDSTRNYVGVLVRITTVSGRFACGFWNVLYCGNIEYNPKGYRQFVLLIQYSTFSTSHRTILH